MRRAHLGHGEGHLAVGDAGEGLLLVEADEVGEVGVEEGVAAALGARLEVEAEVAAVAAAVPEAVLHVVEVARAAAGAREEVLGAAAAAAAAGGEVGALHAVRGALFVLDDVEGGEARLEDVGQVLRDGGEDVDERVGVEAELPSSQKDSIAPAHSLHDTGKCAFAREGYWGKSTVSSKRKGTLDRGRLSKTSCAIFK